MGRALTAQDVTAIWDRVKAGGTIGRVARSLGRNNSTVQAVLVRSGGVRPPARRHGADRLTFPTRDVLVDGWEVPGVIPDPFDALTPEQIESLPPSERAALEEMRAMAPDERVRFLGHVRLISTAWSFLEPAVKDGDLRAAWPVVDPVLRLCLAQQWLGDNAVDLDADGFDREEVAEAFVRDEPRHILWPHFERVHVRSLRQRMPSPDVWGIGANTRLIAPDVELLYVHDTTDMTDGTWRPDELRELYPLLMRWDGARWLVLNLGSEVQPRPGWPPTCD